MRIWGVVFIKRPVSVQESPGQTAAARRPLRRPIPPRPCPAGRSPARAADRKSTRLNSSHSQISYAVFCLKKKINRSNEQHAAPLALAEPKLRLAAPQVGPPC